MTGYEFDTACRALPAVTMDVQWGDDCVYKVGGRMFAVLNPGGHCSLKFSDIGYEALSESGFARPAPYLARAKWLRFDEIGGLEATEMAAWLANAHALVAAKLTRAARRTLGLE